MIGSGFFSKKLRPKNDLTRLLPKVIFIGVLMIIGDELWTRLITFNLIDISRRLFATIVCPMDLSLLQTPINGTLTVVDESSPLVTNVRPTTRGWLIFLTWTVFTVLVIIGFALGLIIQVALSLMSTH